MTIILIISLLLNVLIICAFMGEWTLTRLWRTECKKSRTAHEIQKRVTVGVWNDGVKKWRENHESIPTAFLALAIHVEDLEREINSPANAGQHPTAEAP